MTNSKKEKVASSKDYDDVKNRIGGGGSTYSQIQEKREELKINIEKKVPEEQKENIQTFKKVLFRILKDGLDRSITGNTYLFELIKDVLKKKQLYDGLYKVEVIKKTKDGIICKIYSGNYQTNIKINNEQIMAKKPKEDKLEEIVIMTKKIKNAKGELISKEAQGKQEDFLDEIQYKDSVIIDIQKGQIRKVDLDNIIDEIKTYLKKNDNEKIQAKKIHTAMQFLNDSKDRISSEYISEFFKGMREKQRKRQGKGKEEITKEQFAEVLKRFINKEKSYVHKGNDIDKSALQFLLKKLGIKDDKIFYEIAHSEVNAIHNGLFFDVGGTVNGIKSVDKIVRMKKGGIPIKETKTIISEHSDGSDAALLNNRPCSTTHIIFTIANQLGMISKEELPQMKRFIYFVDAVDSMDYQISSIDYPNNYQTLFGLYRKMDIADIYAYFKNPEHSGFERLSPEYMNSIKIKNNNGTTSTLKKFSEDHHQRIEKNIERFKKLQQEKKEFMFKNQKYIVDLKGEIEDGAQTAGYYGYGYFTIGQERGNIYMYNPQKLPFMIEGYPTDGHFLIINNPAKKNIDRILKKFWCDDEIKKEIREKIEEKYRKKNAHKIIEERKKNLLKPIETKDLKIGKSYTAVINNITNKIIYVYLDNEGKIRGLIKFENKEDAKKFNRGDLIHLRIKEIKTDKENIFIIGTYIPMK